MMKTVLLTGSAGFVGQQTIPFLLDKGYEVHAISREKKTVQRPGVICHICDLFDAEKLAELLKKIRPLYLLHFAWITTPGVYRSSPDNFTWVEASLHLIRLFVKYGGKRAVVAGSCAEYESIPLCSENNNSFQATTFYGQCKRHLYLMLDIFAQRMGFELAWGYLFYLYGPHEHPDRFLPTVIRGILQNKEILLTEGLQIRDFLHVQKAAEGFVELLDSSVQGGFNIASGQGISIRQVVEKIAEKLGGRELLKFGGRPLSLFDPPQLIADMSKSSNAIAWRPSIQLDQEIEEIIEWWKWHTLSNVEQNEFF